MFLMADIIEFDKTDIATVGFILILFKKNPSKEFITRIFKSQYFE